MYHTKARAEAHSGDLFGTVENGRKIARRGVFQTRLETRPYLTMGWARIQRLVMV
jgi:hypothetical protein